MRFGPLATNDASGAILAHSIGLPDGKLSKGTRIGAEEIARLAAAGIGEIVAARLDPGDVDEDSAALALGRALQGPHTRLGPAFTGRVNLIAEADGVIEVAGSRIGRMNAVDEGLTLATLPPWQRVDADQLLATAKVIPYGLPGEKVERAVKALGHSALRLHPFIGGHARLVMTRTPGFRESLLDKGENVVRDRLTPLGYQLDGVRVVDHDATALAAALADEADLTLILGASATSDRADVAPAAVMRAGGAIERFGMPVDPGNLLFLGRLRGAPVVGLPGCARSPALNGVDWVLERLAAGCEVTDTDIAAMGVGGLLKEMQNRPQPRRPATE